MEMRSPIVSDPSSKPTAEAARLVPVRLAAVRRRIDEAALRAGRSPSAVSLVAVTKGFDAQIARAAVAAGQLDLGESRVQELTAKSRALGRGVRWHFVGRLQRNKVREVVGVVSLIHSVDRLSLAEKIAEQVQARWSGRVQRLLVQVNMADDPAKAGCRADEAVDVVAAIRNLPGVACEGLMTVPPLGSDPRPVFAGLRALRDDLREKFPEVQHLSMGMSDDVEVAVEEGATVVRVGEAVFGPRPEA